MNITEQLQEFKATQKNISEQIRELSKTLFIDQSKEIFDMFPDLVSFSWNQYTPYFNDGEACEFGANTDYLTIRTVADPVEDTKKYGGYKEPVDTYSIKRFLNGEHVTMYGSDPFEVYTPTPKEYMALEIEAKLTSHLDDDTLLSMFGDHATITVSRDGVSIDEYDHD